MQIDLVMKDGDYYQVTDLLNPVDFKKVSLGKLLKQKKTQKGIIFTYEFDEGFKLGKKRGRKPKMVELESPESDDGEQKENDKLDFKSTSDRIRAKKTKFQYTKVKNLFTDDMTIGLGDLLSKKAKKKLKPRTIPPRAFKTTYDFQEVRCGTCRRKFKVACYELNLLSKSGRYDEDDEDCMLYKCTGCIGGR